MQLEEYVFSDIGKDVQAGNVSKLAKWLSETVFVGYDKYWQEKVAKDIIVLDDIDFRDFVTLTTEVVTRTKIDNATGTVADGALFTEEYLPAESVMYSLLMFSDEFAKEKDGRHRMKAQKEDGHDGFLEFFDSGLNALGNVMQIGGNMTLGKGIVRTKLVKP